MDIEELLEIDHKISYVAGFKAMDGTDVLDKYGSHTYKVRQSALDIAESAVMKLREDVLLGKLGRNRSDSPADYSELLRTMWEYPVRRKLHGLILFPERGKALVQEKADRKPTIMKLGKYLKHIGLPQDEANEFAARINVELTLADDALLLVANGPEECEHVYANGPSSCMSGCMSYTAKVYGGPDTCILYVQSDDRIIARAVASKLNGKYLPAYGNAALLNKLAAKSGVWREDEYALTAQDHRLLLIDGDCGDPIGPYMDCCDTVYDPGDGYIHTTSDEGGDELHAQSTAGLFEGNCAVCDDCHERIHEEYLTPVRNGWADQVCESCLSYGYVYSDYYEEYIHDDESVWCEYHNSYVLHCDYEEEPEPERDEDDDWEDAA